MHKRTPPPCGISAHLLTGLCLLALAPGCKKESEPAAPGKEAVTQKEEGVAKMEKKAPPVAREPGPGAMAEIRVGTAILVQDAGLLTPESVLYDAEQDLYLVSNLNGNPLEKDDNGFISRLSPEGKVLVLKWVDGAAQKVQLSAPKGMAASGDRLYVTDIKYLRVFERKTGEPVAEIEIPGATFLNDVVAAPEGTIYVSDTGIKEGFERSGTDAIWRIPPGGEPEKLISGRELDRPNGLTLDGDEVVVVTLGSGEMFHVKDGKRAFVKKAPKGSLDGVVRLSDGTFLVSSWQGRAVYRVSADGTFSPLVENLLSPADIGYDSKRRRLLVPLFNDNKVAIYPLEQS